MTASCFFIKAAKRPLSLGNIGLRMPNIPRSEFTEDNFGLWYLAKRRQLGPDSVEQFGQRRAIANRNIINLIKSIIRIGQRRQ
jgi:hypothetical protein